MPTMSIARRASRPRRSTRSAPNGPCRRCIPTEYGGGGVSFETIAAACFELGRRCGASAMVFAMHQIQIASIVRHVDGAPWFEDYLRDVARDQRLVASVTSEIGTGGDLGKSIAAVTPGEDGLATFEKQAPTVSYGAYADDLLTTLRRAPDAEPGDQVVVLTHREQFTLEQMGTWDPMGMRGTCSPGYVVRATFPAEQVLPVPFSTVGTESMVPISHILWSHLWLGHRDRRLRSGACLRASLGQGTAGPAAADRRPPVAAHERAVAPARGGLHRPARLQRCLGRRPRARCPRWPPSFASTT